MTDLTLLRKECPPGACICGRELIVDDPQADRRVLQLTQQEEKNLIARIDAINSYAALRKVEERLHTLLDITLRITPSSRGVRTVRGFQIELVERPGLCKKTRQSIPAAIRRCLENHPQIAFDLLDTAGLLGPD